MLTAALLAALLTGQVVTGDKECAAEGMAATPAFVFLGEVRGVSFSARVTVAGGEKGTDVTLRMSRGEREVTTTLQCGTQGNFEIALKRGLVLVTNHLSTGGSDRTTTWTYGIARSELRPKLIGTTVRNNSR